jgi:hypothetical protein
MTTDQLTDEILMAFADGELDAAASNAVLEALAVDEALAERVAALSDSRRLAKQAFAPLLNEPVPASVEAKVRALLSEAEQPSQGAPAKTPPVAANDNPLRRWRDIAAAACVALAIGAGLGSQLGSMTASDRGPGPGPSTTFAALGRADIADLLASAPSGEERKLSDGARFRAIATFTSAADELCREFEVDGVDGRAVVSVACRAPSQTGWDMRFAVASAQTSDGYAPASSLDALQAWYEQIEAGPPLSAEDERDALNLKR